MPPPVRELASTLGALGAYASTVLPRVRREMRQLGPLPEEKERNAEAVAVFATLAPRSARPTVVRAIVALQVAIDLRDEIEEAAAETETDAAARLRRLDESWRREVATLPSYDTIAPFLDQAVGRCAEGQRRTHAAAAGPVEPLRKWADELDAPPGYRWWEVAAGASSSVAAHVLIAATASPGITAAQAEAIDAAYSPPIGALTVLLDDLVDLEDDRAAGQHNYIGYYAGRAEAAERFAWIARRSEERLDHLPLTPRHRAILAGVAAFYLSQPEANLELGRAIGDEMLTALGPGARFLTTVIRLRRQVGRRRSGQAGNSPGP